MIFGAAAPSSSRAAVVVQEAAFAAQVPFTQPQFGTTAGQSTVAQFVGLVGVRADFAMQAPQQLAPARNSQSVSTLHAFGFAVHAPW